MTTRAKLNKKPETARKPALDTLNDFDEETEWLWLTDPDKYFAMKRGTKP